MPRPTLIDLVSLAGHASDALIMQRLTDAGFPGLRARHGYVFQRLLVAPAGITELATTLGVTQQAMSKTVAELISLGYVEASTHPTDSRRRMLALTAHARASIDEARAARAEFEASIESVVGAERVAAAREALEALLDELGVADRVADRSMPDPGV
jgi:DNA-binding MarR family transcriptional regulator